MTVSLPTPEGPEMITSKAPGAPTSCPGPETAEDRLELQRQGGADLEVPTTVGRFGLQAPGVEEEPLEAGRTAAGEAGGVEGIAGDGMADGGQVDPQLMRPP